MSALRVALGALALAFVSLSAWAQGTGSIVVYVVDESGERLPGVTVTIRHEAGNIKPYAMLTNAKGEALFPVLRPGAGYILEVALPGYGMRRESEIRVPIGGSARIPISLSRETVETVRVTANDEVVDLEKFSSSTKFSDAFVNDLPVPGRFYQNVLTLAPGVNDPDGDGNPIVHGSRSRDFKATVSGVSNVDPLTGQFMSLVNADSIEELEVITGGAGVEFGRAQGGFARIIQKQGTNELEGTFSLLVRSSKLDGTGAHDLTNLPDPEFDELHPAFQISGPIVKDKLWYRLSHEWLKQENPVNTVGQIVIQNRDQGIHSDQLTWQVSPRNKLAFQFQSDPLTIDNFGVSSTTSAESSQKIDTGSETLSVTWTAPFSPKLLIETTAATQDLETTLSPSVEGVLNNCVAGNPFLESAFCTNFETLETSGSNNITNTTNSQRFTLNSQATMYGGRIWGASHQFKFGMSIENERYFSTLDRRPNIGFFILNPIADPDDTSGQTPEEIPVVTATVAVPRESRVRATGTNWAFYLEDQVKPVNNLVITLGLRVDREEINANGLQPMDPEQEFNDFLAAAADDVKPLPIILQNAFTAFEGVNDFVTELSRVTGLLESQIVSSLAQVTLQSGFWNKRREQENFDVVNTNFSPAISVAWDPWGSGKNKFAFSARRYSDKTFLSIPLIELNPATTTLVFDAETVNGEVRTVGLRDSVNPAANIEAVDRDLKTPYQDEWRVFYERQLFTETLLRVEYINRKYRDQLQNIDINHVPGDYGKCNLASPAVPVSMLPSPGSGFELTDQHTGEIYIDTDPGDGDGRIDDCVGTVKVPFVGLDARFELPDGLPDLYTQNPGFGRVLVVGNFNESNYEGYVLELVRRQYRSWELQGSYTYSVSEGNGEDFRQFIGLDQSLLDNEFGFQSSDQRHVVKLNATTITPWGFRLGGSVSWSSGLPYSILTQKLAFDTTAPVFGSFGSASPARQRLQYPTGVRNSERNDQQWLFDVKFTKEMNLGRSLNLQLSAEIFNLFNDGTYQIYNPNFETGFQINGVNSAQFEFGRSWQLGLRMAF